MFLESLTHWCYCCFYRRFVSLCVSPEADSAAVPSSTGSAKDPQGPLKRIFMKEADASNFFRRRSRRGVKSQDEINAEQRLVLAADERKREFHEEKRNEFESHAEEEHDEQDERTRESTEQWREFHYDGMHPPHEYNRHAI
ncbi:unique cartilage matrix-associated protein isoform X2 [Lates calcarifer]|uniref:Unique cartilage matrix-associated protein n=1 Tax=Lates calcarifer TaxID=8187 RepID=A0AAJ8DRW8_LATCA|nr:unique cartilage matrix-associated protein isoform X2 [Lates calcarifer]